MRKKTSKLLKSGALLKKVTLGNYPHTRVTIMNTPEEIKRVKKKIVKEEKEYNKQLKQDKREYKNEERKNNPSQNKMTKLLNIFRKTRKNLPTIEFEPIQYKSPFRERSSSSSTKKIIRESLKKNNKKLEEMGIDPQRIKNFIRDSNNPLDFRVEYR